MIHELDEIAEARSERQSALWTAACDRIARGLILDQPDSIGRAFFATAYQTLCRAAAADKKRLTEQRQQGRIKPCRARV